MGVSHHSGNPNIAIDISIGSADRRRRHRRGCRRRHCRRRRRSSSVIVMCRRVVPKIGADSASINALLSLLRLWLYTSFLSLSSGAWAISEPLNRNHVGLPRIGYPKVYSLNGMIVRNATPPVHVVILTSNTRGPFGSSSIPKKYIRLESTETHTVILAWHF